MPLTTTRKAIRQKAIKRLYSPRYPIVSTTTAAANKTTSLVDSALAPSGQVEDYIGAWVYVAETEAGSPAVGEVARVTNVDFSTLSITSASVEAGATTIITTSAAHGLVVNDWVTIDGSNSTPTIDGVQQVTAVPSTTTFNIAVDVTTAGTAGTVRNSKLTVSPAFSATMNASMDYELHYKFHPTAVNDKINEILENVRDWVIIPVSGLVTNGNFDSGVTSWTTSGGATITTETGSAEGLFGARSASVIASSPAYVYQRIYVSPNTPLLLSAFVFVEASSGSTAELKLWDVTNNAQIGDTAQVDASGEWVNLLVTATVPATCERVEIRLSGAAVYFDSVQLLRRDQYIQTLPSDFDWPEDLTLIVYSPLGDTISTSGSDYAYRALQYPFEKWADSKVLSDPQRAQRVQILDKKEIDKPLFFKGRVNFATVSSDSTSIYAPEDYVSALVYADLMDELAQQDLDNNNLEAYQAKMLKSNDIRTKISLDARRRSADSGVVKGTFSK